MKEIRGIYSILVDGVSVYIGQSTDINTRIVQHKRAIKVDNEFKYRVLRRISIAAMQIDFKIIHIAREDEDLNELEQEYMRKIPCLLNTAGRWKISNQWDDRLLDMYNEELMNKSKKKDTSRILKDVVVEEPQKGLPLKEGKVSSKFLCEWFGGISSSALTQSIDKKLEILNIYYCDIIRDPDAKGKYIISNIRQYYRYRRADVVSWYLYQNRERLIDSSVSAIAAEIYENEFVAEEDSRGLEREVRKWMAALYQEYI